MGLLVDLWAKFVVLIDVIAFAAALETVGSGAGMLQLAHGLTFNVVMTRWEDTGASSQLQVYDHTRLCIYR